ncbi:MAG: stage V sporulation T C-terminal domain-containing protein [Evtepia gabavorous]
MSDYTDHYVVSTAAPILSEGDVLGCVVFLCEKDQHGRGRVRVQAGPDHRRFSGRHMET